MNYDTGELRRLARKVQGAASTVADIRDGSLQAARREAASLQGDAATALQGELAALAHGIGSIAGSLGDMAASLNGFAARLDEADREASRYIAKE